MVKKVIKSVIRKFGYDVVPYCLPADFETRHREIIAKVSPYTVTSHERVHALVESVRYILQNDVKGDFVECGVYKGGSMMAVALTLMAQGVNDRELYLFDTFEGMPAPEDRDIDVHGKPALEVFSKKKISDVSSTWVNAALEDVKQAMASTGYPMQRMHFVKGLVENTIPAQAPESIALLRLDTDWYRSTIHELTHLYPRLSPKGVIIVDDYGHFKGAREAVDEFFRKRKLTPFLHRVDYAGRLIIKEE
jgi:O-methyltransferase